MPTAGAKFNTWPFARRDHLTHRGTGPRVRAHASGLGPRPLFPL